MMMCVSVFQRTFLFLLTVSERVRSKVMLKSSSSRSGKRSRSPGTTESSSKRSKSTQSINSSPSGNSSIRGGQNVWQQLHRSVLYHPLGLPLTVALHNERPEDLPFLSQQRRNIQNHHVDKILQQSFNEWTNNGDLKETMLMKKLSDNIADLALQTTVHAENEVVVQKRCGGIERIDVLLSSNTDEKEPLAIIKVGLDNGDWWAKFDQGTKYVNSLMESSMERPLLFATLTISKVFKQSKLGVFMCVPSSSPSSNNPNANYRMIALGYTVSNTLKDASKAFGQLLRTTAWFSDWIAAEPTSAATFQYLSSNCCLVGGTHVR